jgi:quercetin dioxygenase-like cupin family protein
MRVFDFTSRESMKDLLYHDDAQTIIHLSLKEGQEIPEHRHRGADAIVTVIPVKGKVTFSTPGQTETLVPGRVIRLNAHDLHGMKAVQSSDLVVVKWNQTGEASSSQETSQS